MILVRLQCPRCNREVARVEHRPESWSGVLRFRSCKCVRERAGTPRTWDQWEAVRQVHWEDLRPHIEHAERRGKTVRLMIDPVS